MNAQLASVGDRVWKDVNANGLQEVGEPGLGNVLVDLFSESGSVAATTLSSSSGFYSLGGLAGALVSLRFTAPAGYIATRRDVGSDDTLDSDIDRGTLSTGAFISPGAGNTNTDWDAGFLLAAKITGTVFNDRNRDSVKQSSDEAMEAFLLFLDQNANDTIDPGEHVVSSTVTGTYSFSDLLPDNYRVVMATQDLWEVPAPVMINLAPSSTNTTHRPVTTQVSDYSVVTQGSETQANTTPASGPAQVAVDAEGRFVVVWRTFGQDGSGYGVYARRFDASGTPLSSEFRVNTYTTGDQTDPVVACLSGGGFVIVWESSPQDGFAVGVYAQVYDSLGAPVGGEFRVNVATSRQEQYPVVGAYEDGSFAVTWAAALSSDGGPLMARKFNASGTPLTGEISLGVTGGRIDLAMNPDGDAVVVWQEAFVFPSIFARRFDSSFAPLGEAFVVAQWSDFTKRNPSVGMDAEGRFVIAWENGSSTIPGSNGMYARRFNQDGVPQGGPFTVSGDGANASVGMGADGDFIIASGHRDVYIQRFTAAGVPQGPPHRVNTYTTNTQIHPAIAVDDGGNFIVAWKSDPQQGIFFQRFVERPFVLTAQFVWDGGPSRVRFTFNQDVSASIAPGDLLVENLNDPSLNLSGVIVSNVETDPHIASFSFPSLAHGGALPNGRYRATVAAANVSNTDGVTMANNFTFEFFFINGDANHDGIVDLRDLYALSNNWLLPSNFDYTKGDFNSTGS